MRTYLRVWWCFDFNENVTRTHGCLRAHLIISRDDRLIYAVVGTFWYGLVTCPPYSGLANAHSRQGPRPPGPSFAFVWALGDVRRWNYDNNNCWLMTVFPGGIWVMSMIASMPSSAAWVRI